MEAKGAASFSMVISKKFKMETIFSSVILNPPIFLMLSKFIFILKSVSFLGKTSNKGESIFPLEISKISSQALNRAGNTILESTPLSYLKDASVFNPCLLAVFLIETGLKRALSINIFFVFSVTPESFPPKTPPIHISFALSQIIISFS